ncbi:MAG: hypothetical protein ACYS1A_01745 [Planctomycetota bacterium]|jgi:hypothetical protein
MKKHISIYIIVYFNIIIIQANALGVTGKDILGEKIRAGYMGIFNSDVLAKMADNKMNLALVKFNSLQSPIQPEEQKILVKWAKECNDAGVLLMPVINLWGQNEYKWIKPKYHQYYDNINLNKTPCPLEYQVYAKAIHERFLELSKLSQTIPIAGVAIDLEMYNANIAAFADYCLCDYCFERFLQGRTVSNPIAIDQREDYLSKTKQFKAYLEFMENHVSQMVKKTLQQLKDTNPDFLIGALDLDVDNTYCRGFTKGFGDSRTPVLVFAENTYYTGYTDEVSKLTRRFKDYNAKLVIGLWQRKFPPANLAEQYYHCAKDSDGYWIYTMESLSSRDFKSLPFNNRYYWQAIHLANSELSKLRINSNYKSHLKVRSFSSPQEKAVVNKTDFEPVNYINKNIRQESNIEPIRLRFFNKLVFVASQGDALDFKVSYSKKGRAKAPYIDISLVSQTGEAIATERASFLKPAKVGLKAPYSGSYLLAIQSHGNGAKIVKSSHPYGIDTSETMHLLKPTGKLYLHKPAKVTSATVQLYVDGIGESIIAIFKDYNNKIIGKYDIIGKQNISMEFSDKEQIIELNITPRENVYFEDVRIRVISGFNKYISPYKSGLIYSGKR